ncbi:MAG: hypothetical protein Q9M19_05675 [Mariprofundaceae bacterium]|nr:hypothetical protein [Mariprofundaceae bacterium]
MSHGKETAYSRLADLQLWYKIQDESVLKLSDVPAIIPLRWFYFRDQWEFFKPGLEARVATYFEPDMLRSHIDTLDTFIKVQRTSPIPNPFSKRSVLFKYYSVFDNMELAKLNISYEERIIVEAEIKRVSRFTKTDFIDIRDNLRAARDELADQAGGTDESYNATFTRNAVPARTNIRILDISIMRLFSEGLKSIDFILANIFSLDTTTVDPFALAKANANNSAYALEQHKSGRLTTLNFGEDLQSLAARTMGDPDKFIEIAIANGLKAPYVDEIGEKISLISNGNSNLINIAKSDNNGEPNFNKFYVNQVVFLSSNTETVQDQRTVQSIKEVAISGEIILEFDGEKDLSRYKLAENAAIRVFKPNTINSSFMILIPSTEPLPDDLKQEVPFFLKSSTEDERQAKVDLFMTDDRDLNFTSSGDLQLSYGLQNAAQAIAIKMEVERGTLSRHPNFGLVNVKGELTNNTSGLKAMLSSSITQQVESDPRFERLEQITVQYVSDLHGFKIYLQARLSGSQVVIPISFSVNL